MPTAIINDLDKIISEVFKHDDLDKKINEFYNSMGQTTSKNKAKIGTVVIFDLTESTSLKMKIGHNEVMKKILLHDKICRLIIKRFDGDIIKETGDGIMALFENPLNACLSAINVLQVTTKKEISTKAALALGFIEKIKIGDKIDVFGTAVDICSRIEKHASDNQILMNRALYDAVLSFLKSYEDILISDPMNITLKGFGKSELYEIASKQSGLKNYITLPFQNNEQSRLATNEKIELMQNAKFEIIEVGSGFLDFITHFKNVNEFTDFVKNLLKRGINIKCIVAEPDWISEKLKSNEGLVLESFLILKNHLDILGELQKEFNSEKSSARFEIFVYKKLPLFHALCIDPNNERGIMAVSNYLYGVEESENPEIQFSKTANPAMFNAYLASINYLIKNSHLQ